MYKGNAELKKIWANIFDHRTSPTKPRAITLKFVFTPNVNRDAADMTYETLILTDELNVLCKYAHEHCQFCDRTNCSQCDLGKTFDSILTDDRDGGCWSTIDIFGHEEV